MVGTGSVQSSSVAGGSAVQLSGFMDSLPVENVLLCSGPCPD